MLHKRNKTKTKTRKIQANNGMVMLRPYAGQQSNKLVIFTKPPYCLFSSKIAVGLKCLGYQWAVIVLQVIKFVIFFLSLAIIVTDICIDIYLLKINSD
jgi:hypothetical protein